MSKHIVISIRRNREVYDSDKLWLSVIVYDMQLMLYCYIQEKKNCIISVYLKLMFHFIKLETTMSHNDVFLEPDQIKNMKIFIDYMFKWYWSQKAQVTN